MENSRLKGLLAGWRPSSHSASQAPRKHCRMPVWFRKNIADKLFQPVRVSLIPGSPPILEQPGLVLGGGHHYSIISSKLYIVKRKVAIFQDFLLFSFLRSGIRRNNASAQLAICHARASASRSNQGVDSKVMHQPLARSTTATSGEAESSN